MDAKECAVCSAISLHRCLKCKLAAYCSPAHQALVWPLHKMICGKDPSRFVQADFTRAESDFAMRNMLVLREPFAAQGGAVGPNESSALEQLIREERGRPNADSLELYWRECRRILDSMDPSKRNSSTANMRSTIFETTQLAHAFGIALSTFYEVASIQEAPGPYAREPLLALSVSLLLHRAFDYFSLEALARIK